MSSDPEIARLLQSAAAAQAAARTDLARQQLESVLTLAPEHPIALNSLGALALRSGDAAGAAQLFARAAAADPSAGPLWLNLANAQRLLGDDEGERSSLLRALDCDQRDLTALIRLAELHERRGEEAAAAYRWSAVVALGRGLQRPSPELAKILDHAAAYAAERTRLLGEALDLGLARSREGLGWSERRRFDAAIDYSLGRRSIYSNDCAGLFFPFLPADEYFDRSHFPWMAAIEAETDAIRAELEALLSSGGEGLRPYVHQDPGTPPNKWSELDNDLAWGAYFLWEYGERQEEACARCPRTAAALEALPRADIPGRAPSAFFSLLRPRTRIPPHTGVSNTRAIVHLPLIVPDGCAFRVGGETRPWRVGEAFAFDDTIEHEAWNDSDELRALLIFDVWNPHLTETEKRLLQDFYRVADASGRNPEPRERL
jgi:aspartyl/asparaginyl beta-hydroxylase (cupin superfamily)